MNFIEQGTRVVFYFLALSPWTFKVWFGEEWATWAWLFAEAPGYAAKGFYGWYIVRKKLFPDQPIKFPWYKALIAPAICMVPFALIFQFVMKPIFVLVFSLSEIAAYGLAALYLILILFIFPIFIILPLYGYLGAWDEQSLDDFRRASIMAGPSKGLVKALYITSKWGYNKSPFKGRFIIPFKKAMAQADEITSKRKKIEESV
jgi:hypothetical protein